MAGKVAGRIGVLVLAAVLGGLISNKIGVKAQSGLVGGGYRVSLTLPGGPFPVGALLTSEGGVIGNVAQLPCLATGGESIGTVFGTWGISTSHGLNIQFQMVGPVYKGAGVLGELGIVGSFPMIGTQGAGTATVSVPANSACSGLNGILGFTATRIPPVPLNLTDTP